MLLKRFTVAVVVLAIGFAGMPQALATKKGTVEVDGYRTSAELRGVGFEWVTPLSDPHQLIIHMRQMPGQETWEGHEYLQGEMFNNINYDAHGEFSEDWAEFTVSGNVYGTAFVTLDAFEGGWEGTYDFRIYDVGEFYSFEGLFTAEGWGELEGWYLELSVNQDGFTHTETLTGFVLEPKVKKKP